MSIALMNAQLHRNIKNGKQYDKYFSDAQCKSVFLGKGVTSFGLQKMKDWTNLHYLQASKIAKVLQKNSLQSTVLSFKQFLYDHIQYDADGFEQELKSPNCAWSSKKADCKTYSLFAGSMLKALNIPFSYRKIKQPASPERWSHVYIVVKDKNGKELIIDATVPYNYEVQKIDQEDLKMEANLPYYGLNGMQSVSIAVPTTQANAVAEFRKYIATLKSAGVSEFVTNRIENEIRKSTDRGIDPQISIDKDNISINKVVIPYGVTLGMQGMGFVATAAVAGSSLLKDIDFGKLFGSFSSLFGGGTDAAVFLAEGAKWVAEARQKLQAGLDANPSAAMSAYAKKLAEGVVEFQYRLENSSQGKTKDGNTKSRNDVQEALSALPELEQKLSPSFSIQKSTRSETITHSTLKKLGSKTLSYLVYTLTPKTGSKGNSVNFGFPTNTTDLVGIVPQTGGSNILDKLVKIAEGLFQDTTTGKTYSQSEINQLRVNETDLSKSKANEGLSTMQIVGIAAGGLVVVGGVVYVLKQKKII